MKTVPSGSIVRRRVRNSKTRSFSRTRYARKRIAAPVLSTRMTCPSRLRYPNSTPGRKAEGLITSRGPANVGGSGLREELLDHPVGVERHEVVVRLAGADEQDRLPDGVRDAERRAALR